MVDRMGLEEAFSVLPEYRALSDAPDSSVARLRLFNALARRHLVNVHRQVLKFGRGKGIGLEDPVLAAAAASEEELRALAADDNRATLVHYFDTRLALIDQVQHANPRFAKLAFGRGAMWPLIEEAWTDLCEWTDYFVRRLQLTMMIRRRRPPPLRRRRCCTRRTRRARPRPREGSAVDKEARFAVRCGCCCCWRRRRSRAWDRSGA
jgi:hypothetical protein